MSSIPDVRVPRFLDRWMSRFSDFEVAAFLDVQNSWVLDFGGVSF